MQIFIFLTVLLIAVLARAAKIGEFALNVLKEKPNENVLFSPASIAIGLGMPYFGAVGATKSQMKNVLYGSKTDQELLTHMKNAVTTLGSASTKNKLNVANRVYIHQGRPPFKNYTDILKNNFNSEIVQKNFATDSSAIETEINHWVETQTNNKIKNTLSPGSLNSMTRMVLINALYFKGEWQRHFDTKKTKREVFRNSPTKNVTVDTMLESSLNFQYFSNDDVQVLGLPYVHQADDKLQFSMFLILPKQTFGLKNFEQTTTYDNLVRLINQTHTTKLARVAVPKFRVEYELKLKEMLKKFGATNMFDRLLADFSAINGQRDLFMSNVVHKTFIQLTEHGTEAAAVTVSDMRTFSLPQESFIADHPFLFLIVDTKKFMPLFVGRFTG